MCISLPPYWDSDRKRGAHRREYVGKTSVQGGFVPNSRWRLRVADEQARRGPEPAARCSRRFAGATHAMGMIAARLGMDRDLAAVFGDRVADSLLSLAFYLCSEAGSPMYRFERYVRDA